MYSVTRQSAIAVFCGLCLLALAGVASAGVLHPFKAQYSVARGSLNLGVATFSLKPWGDSGCMEYHGLAKPRFVLRLFLGEIEETSYFCPGDKGTLVPYHYIYRQTGHKSKNYRLDFDWQTGKVTYQGKDAKGGKHRFAVPKGAVDSFLLQLAPRVWLASVDNPLNAGSRKFTIIDGNEIKHYTLGVKPAGTVKTPAGPYDTIKVQRVDEKHKQLIFWVAPKLDYLPVKVNRHKSGDPDITMVLTRYSQHPAKTQSKAK